MYSSLVKKENNLLKILFIIILFWVLLISFLLNLSKYWFSNSTKLIDYPVGAVNEEANEPEILEKTSWSIKDAIKNLGNIFLEWKDSEIANLVFMNGFLLDDFIFSEEEPGYFTKKVYGIPTRENQWEYEVITTASFNYIDDDNDNFKKEAIKKHNQIFKDQFLNLIDHTFEVTNQGFRIERFDLNVPIKNTGEMIKIYFTTIFLDFIFYDLNKNLEQVIDSTIKIFNNFYSERGKEFSIYRRGRNVWLQNGLKSYEELEYDDNDNKTLTPFVFSIFLDKVLSDYEDELNKYNWEVSKFKYLKYTTYLIQSTITDPRILKAVPEKGFPIGISFAKRIKYVKVFDTWKTELKTPFYILIKDDFLDNK